MRQTELLVQAWPGVATSADAPGLPPVQPAASFPLSTVSSSRHICFTFTDRQEHLQVVTQYLAEGLALGERVLCFIEDLTFAELTASLEAYGVDVAKQAALGALQITRARSVYVQDGGFDAEKMLRQVIELFQAARETGYQGVRASGDMSWILAGAKGIEQVVAYEQQISQMIAQLPGFTGMCQYDLGRFQTPFIREVMAVHPLHVAPHSKAATFPFATA